MKHIIEHADRHTSKISSDDYDRIGDILDQARDLGDDGNLSDKQAINNGIKKLSNTKKEFLKNYTITDKKTNKEYRLIDDKGKITDFALGEFASKFESMESNMSKFELYLESIKAPNDNLKVGDTLQSIKSKEHYIV